MSYALIESGKVKTYPYSFARLKADNRDTSFPDKASDEVLARHGVHPVIRVDQPEASSHTKNIFEGPPALINGVWTQTWHEVDASAEEAEARQKDATEKAARRELKQDAFIKAFAEMTPAQIEEFVEANTTKVVLKKTLKLLRLLVRDIG